MRLPGGALRLTMHPVGVGIWVQNESAGQGSAAAGRDTKSQLPCTKRAGLDNAAAAAQSVSG